MKIGCHTSAQPSHYDDEAQDYDTFNEEASRITNQRIEKILKKYKIKTVLDLSCGTGSQVFFLAKNGYEIAGADINAKMLTIARSKAKKEKLNIKFHKADMRSAQLGAFDAAITIFNAIGHLTKSDFEKSLRNIRDNLKDKGIYIFDIFNLDYFLHQDNITKLSIDWFKKTGDSNRRIIQYSTIDEAGILASFTTAIVQKNGRRPQMRESSQTLQIYRAAQLKEILKKNGFALLTLCAIDGARFDDKKTERMLLTAQKE